MQSPLVPGESQGRNSNYSFRKRDSIFQSGPEQTESLPRLTHMINM